MTTLFVPYSVTMRSAGYVRVPRTQKWVPESVLEMRKKREEEERLARPLRVMMRTDPTCLALANGVSWGELAQQEQDRVDAPYLAMTDEQWREHLRTDRSQSWEECQRIQRRRDVQKAIAEEPAPVEQPKTPAYWYNEYVRYPHLYFANEEEQQQAIAEVLEDWRVGTGRWRVGAMEQAARVIQNAWRQHEKADDGCRKCGQACADGYTICGRCLDRPICYCDDCLSDC